MSVPFDVRVGYFSEQKKMKGFFLSLTNFMPIKPTLTNFNLFSFDFKSVAPLNTN